MAGALPGFVTLLGSITFVVNSESSVRTFSYDREVTTLEDAVKPEDSVRDLENEFIEDLGRVASQAEINSKGVENYLNFDLLLSRSFYSFIFCLAFGYDSHLKVPYNEC